MSVNAYANSTFETLVGRLRRDLLKAPSVNVGSWQSQDVSSRPEMRTQELTNVSFGYCIPSGYEALGKETQANLPWAEDHFQERVSGIPYNPPPSAAWWPYAQKDNVQHKDDEKFSHTYPERMWPKQAGHEPYYDGGWFQDEGHKGIRFHYGDLQDVIGHLLVQPFSRQAFLPIWFPEDTGVLQGQRVPCTLGYHFLIRSREADDSLSLQVTYYIRSCDFVRHFRDDVYMAARLGQFIAGELTQGGVEVTAHELLMHIVSLHIFQGDLLFLKLQDFEYQQGFHSRLMRAL